VTSEEERQRMASRKQLRAEARTLDESSSCGLAWRRVVADARWRDGVHGHVETGGVQRHRDRAGSGGVLEYLVCRLK
jgi:hypothetical protein